MKKVASCSFGKDSLAAIIVSEEHGVHIDEAIYCRIMFDDQISAELPEHEEFIHSELCDRRFGNRKPGFETDGAGRGHSRPRAEAAGQTIKNQRRYFVNGGNQP